MGLNKIQENLEVAKLENSVILTEKDYKSRYEGYDPKLPESDIILSLFQNAYLEQSTLLASKIQKQFTEKAGRKDLGVRQAGLIVLWNCTMPSVLVETGFISNPTEEKYLMSDYGQSIIASAVFRAFRSYKEEIEKKSNFEIKGEDSKDVSKSDSNTSKSSGNISDKKKDPQKKENITENQVNDKIIYKIQIKTSIKKIELNAKNFKGIENPEEFSEDGIFKYTVGNSESYDEIAKLLLEIRKKIPDAFITAFKNGNKIGIDNTKIGRYRH
jgi:N-acetylmuramoyl-L-alanine amidase